MTGSELAKKFFLEPGYVCVPYQPMLLAGMVASGVAVTMYNRRTRRGGMSIYTHPRRINNLSTAVFAAPAITSLVGMFTNDGDNPRDLEAHIYGGSINVHSEYFVPRQSEDNVAVGEEILKRLNIGLSGKDIGGYRGRKIMFHTGTGEIVVAKVNEIRPIDWYPPFDPEERKKREHC